MVFRSSKVILIVCICIMVLAIGWIAAGSLGSAGAAALTIVSYGDGSYMKSQERAFVEPFRNRERIGVRMVGWSARYNDLERMAEDGGWDVVDVPDALFWRGRGEGLFAPVGSGLTGEEFMEGCLDDFGVVNVYWATALAYNTQRYSGEEPTSWRDFWDVERFPGGRALRDDPRGAIEFALLANGTRPEDLYPLDVDTAFQHLDALAPYVTLWWNDGELPVRSLEKGAVVMASVWTGRVFAAQLKGSSVAVSWKQAALERDWWVLMANSRAKELGRRFIAFASSSGRLAEQSRQIGYGPANLEALSLIPLSLRRGLPTASENWQQAFHVDSSWWSVNGDILQERWERWRQQWSMSGGSPPL